MAVPCKIKKVEYQKRLPSVGPLVEIQNVRQVVYVPIRLVGYLSGGGPIWVEDNPACKGYLVMDNADTVEDLLNLVGENSPAGTEYDLFVTYEFGKRTRRKQFKGVIFGDSFFYLTRSRIAPAPDAGVPAGQAVSFHMIGFGIPYEMDFLCNHIITTDV